MIAIKRIYEPPSPNDGYRVLIDRLWPRGVSREKAALDEWVKEVAPSPALRVWFDHRDERWVEFQGRYRLELSTPELEEALARLRQHASDAGLTLITANRKEVPNHSTVLRDVLSMT